MNRKASRTLVAWGLATAFGLAAFALAHAAPLSGPALVAALRQGGYVILMRHASSPFTPPEAGAADPQNVHLERQLDERGRSTARAMGAALKRLRIPVGEVLSSPTYRALETIRLAGLPAAQTFDELGDRGQSMQAAAGSQADWLRARVAQPPRGGTDTIIVTHYPNIAGAFGRQASGLTDGEAMIFHPERQGAELVGRIKIEDWPTLAKQP
ncbi:MAG TPA: histidine phosphatase family protein [Caulobacteraceae bacterium]|jgi:phosphohistidine phosphatase SixA|nr:histidine phosphatase family protein [Caulobacteraceae bacterium]